MSDVPPKKPLRYADAGVDIDRANAAKDKITSIARSTFSPAVLSEIGLFGGLFQLDVGAYDEPVLVASTDGVGTKLKLAEATGCHTTIGQDLVNHSVNDILVQGAEPLFFLDYFASSGLPPERVAAVIEGIGIACRENGTALLGGETAEMPGFYQPGDYDLAGTIVGVVDKKRVIDGKQITPGDILYGLPSTGLHTNGYSLARKIFFELEGLNVDSRLPELDASLGDVLLAIHKSYLVPLRPPIAAGIVKGLAHITGGGITDNLPRILPDAVEARVDRTSWTVPPIFELMQKMGGVETAEMFRTFNMGIGMIVVTKPSDLAQLKEMLPDGTVIGEIASGSSGVSYRA